MRVPKGRGASSIPRPKAAGAIPAARAPLTRPVRDEGSSHRAVTGEHPLGRPSPIDGRLEGFESSLAEPT